MAPKEFVEAVIDLYWKARIPLRPHAKIHRGQSRSISSETEDLLAYYLATRIDSIEHIFINQPMGAAGLPAIKPDLVICRGSEICGLIDVKMDLGYKRDKFESTLREMDVLMPQMRGQFWGFLTPGEGKKKRAVMRLSNDAKYSFVVISNKNIAPSRFGVIEACASGLCHTLLHVLTRIFHPNERCESQQEVMRRMTICEDAFTCLEDDLRRTLLSVN